MPIKGFFRTWLNLLPGGLGLLLLLLLITATTAYSQTWDEWFSQKKTQQKYLLEQMVALKVYAGYLNQGYDIANSGLQTVKDISRGEFNLHNAFISSLKAVNPAIRNHVKVAEIMASQVQISKAFNVLRNDNRLALSERLYLIDVKDNILEECGKNLEELLLVITSGKVEMNDDERIKRLDKVYENVKDKYAFTQSFCNQFNLLIRQREHEQKSINQIWKWYEKD